VRCTFAAALDGAALALVAGAPTVGSGFPSGAPPHAKASDAKRTDASRRSEFEDLID
jgi:hypothetical protein